MTTQTTTPVVLEGETARDVSDALADVLCWFRGFTAAKSDADLPPGLETLRTLNIKLKAAYE